MENPIQYESDGGVFIIQLNRPQNGNMINDDILLGFADICEKIIAGEGVKAVIITGSGKRAFCTGAEKAPSSTFSRQSMTSLIDQLRCPVIAAINGDALGQGLELALACDIRITVPEAKFSLPQIKDGLLPIEGGTQRLPRIVGLTKAMELALTGDAINAGEALRIGLVSQIVKAEDLMTTAKNMATLMAGKSELALSYAKEAINKGLDLTLEQGLRFEADLYFLLHTTQDRSEGIKAFREKRKPEFKGR